MSSLNGEQPAGEIDAALHSGREQLIGPGRARFRAELRGPPERGGLPIPLRIHASTSRSSLTAAP